MSSSSDEDDITGGGNQMGGFYHTGNGPDIDSEEEEEEEDEALSYDQKMKQLYYMNNEKAERGDQLTKINLEEDPKIRDHIVVVGMHSSIEDFIRPLRSRSIPEKYL